MSFLARVFINDRVINVQSSKIHFSQSKDIANKPSGRVNGGLFTLVLEMDGKTDLLHQMMAIEQTVGGHVRFYKRDGMSKLIDYEFKDAYIYKYHMTQTANGTNPALVAVSFSPGALRIGHVIYKKPWSDAEFESFDQNTNVESDQTEERNIQEISFESMEEQPLNELQMGKEVYIVVQSSGMGQHETDVDLSDYEVGFEYQGESVAGNIFKDISFTGSYKKIKVKVIPKKQ